MERRDSRRRRWKLTAGDHEGRGHSVTTESNHLIGGLPLRPTKTPLDVTHLRTRRKPVHKSIGEKKPRSLQRILTASNNYFSAASHARSAQDAAHC